MRKLVLETPPVLGIRVYGALLIAGALYLFAFVAPRSGLPEIWALSVLPLLAGVTCLAARTFWFVERGTGRVWRSMFLPRGGRLLSTGVTRVTIARDVRLVGKGKRFVPGNVYPVFLFPGAEEVDADQDPLRARQLAQALAQGLQVPLRDHSAEADDED